MSVKIHKAEIPPETCDAAIAMVKAAMDKFQVEKDIATEVKKKCDDKFGGTWHVVVGRNFGCSITHDTSFSIGVFAGSGISRVRTNSSKFVLNLISK